MHKQRSLSRSNKVNICIYSMERAHLLPYLVRTPTPFTFSHTHSPSSVQSNNIERRAILRKITTHKARVATNAHEHIKYPAAAQRQHDVASSAQITGSEVNRMIVRARALHACSRCAACRHMHVSPVFVYASMQI